MILKWVRGDEKIPRLRFQTALPFAPAGFGYAQNDRRGWVRLFMMHRGLRLTSPCGECVKFAMQTLRAIRESPLRVCVKF